MEENKAKRFQQGLKRWIRSKVKMFELITYAEIVQNALVSEGESGISQKEREGKKIKMDVEEGSQHQSNFQTRFNRRPWVSGK